MLKKAQFLNNIHNTFFLKICVFTKGKFGVKLLTYRVSLSSKIFKLAFSVIFMRFMAKMS